MENITTIKLYDYILKVSEDKDAKYSIKGNYHIKGRVPNYIIDNYSYINICKMFDLLNLFNEDNLNKIKSNVYYLISILKGCIRYFFYTWSLTYDWINFDKLSDNIKSKCNNSADNNNISIINSLLMIGDCREHGYLTAFMFNSFIIYCNNKYSNINLNYRLEIIYATFYINKNNKDCLTPFLNVNEHDHVLCVLKNISDNKYLHIVDSLDVSSDFLSKNPPLYDNLHLHFINCNDIINVNKDNNDILQKVEANIQNDTIKKKITTKQNTNALFYVKNGQFSTCDVYFLIVDFLTDLEVFNDKYNSNTYLCKNILQGKSFESIIKDEIYGVILYKKDRLKTIFNINSNNFFGHVRYPSIKECIDNQLQSLHNKYKHLLPSNNNNKFMTYSYSYISGVYYHNNKKNKKKHTKQNKKQKHHKKHNYTHKKNL